MLMLTRGNKIQLMCKLFMILTSIDIFWILEGLSFFLEQFLGPLETSEWKVLSMGSGF